MLPAEAGVPSATLSRALRHSSAAFSLCLILQDLFWYKTRTLTILMPRSVGFCGGSAQPWRVENPAQGSQTL